MGFLIKKLVMKAAEKASKTDITDILNQQAADDILQLLKELLL